MRETIMPPTTAAIKPAKAGKLEAKAIPRLKGKAIREILKPALKSAKKFSFKPIRPDLGTSMVLIGSMGCAIFKMIPSLLIDIRF
ncbi:MAG: hypothetical protein ACU4EP_05175 [Candidatus Nitrosoglobus sp.]